jgi:ABC-type transport system involved in multi-copper enzyme maturation permease subunit
MEFGPVFEWEWRRVTRQRWSYAARSVMVGALLVGLGAAWWAGVSRLEMNRADQMAKAGEWFFAVVAVGQVSMALFAAPAATAGAFCNQLVRGHLGLMLISGVAAAEIVVGTLGARLMTVLSIVMSALPVLALGMHLGGIPPQALVRLEVVTVGCAVLGCSLALVFSVEADRLHEALMATYVVLVGWVLGYPVLVAIQLTAMGRFIPTGWIGASLAVNPYALVLQATMNPSSYRPEHGWLFLGSSFGIAVALAALACWRLAPATLGASSQASRRSWFPRLSNLSLVSLDVYPLFWRECRLRSPTRWFGLLWAAYVVGAILFTALAVGEATLAGARRSTWTGPFNGFQSAVGLLLLSIVSPAALAEERSRGGLELILATPLSTRSLVLSKWCGCYRGIAALALLPTLVALAHAVQSGRWAGVPLVLATVLAQGAAITSLGIALATWFTRIERALIVSVAASVLVTAAWIPFVVILISANDVSLGLAAASPLLGIGLLTNSIRQASAADWQTRAGWCLFWIFAYSTVSLSLLAATVATFDRCVGRTRSRNQGRRPRATSLPTSIG